MLADRTSLDLPEIPPGRLPDRDDPIWAVLATTMSDGQVGKLYGVSRQAAFKQRWRAGYGPSTVPTQLQSAMGYIPWTVEWSERDHPLLEMLREAWRADDGRAISDPVGLKRWLVFMRDARLDDGTPIGRGVVVYDRSLPAGQRLWIEPWRKGDMVYSRP